MAQKTGYKHSEATRLKMSASRKGHRQSEDVKRKIGEANRGRKLPAKHSGVCVCGVTFTGTQPTKIFCSKKCGKAARGHGLIHSIDFSDFKKICAICGSVEELVGDHDHKTGKARGVLCRKCNLAIGNMMDDPSRLRRAADYLEAIS